MPVEDTNPRATKALKRDQATSIHNHRNMRSLAHVESVMHHVLQYLPLTSLSEFLEACGDSQDLEWTLQDAQLWTELLQLHFGGRREVVEDPEPLPPVNNGFGFGNGDDDDDDGDDDDDDEDNSENSDQDESDDVDPENHLTSPEPNNTEATDNAVPSTDSTNDPSADASTEPTDEATPTINVEHITLPSWFDASKACDEAREFVVSLVEWQQFSSRFTVLRGDIGVIENIGDRAIDGIAFPGNNSLHNAHNGSSGVVFRRAGRALEEHTRTLNVSLRCGQSYVTPGFNAGVRVIIHCHGPYIGYQNTFEVLAQTYRSALTNAKQENVDCLAMASISTGNHGLPIDQSTRVAVRAIQKFLRLHHDWQGHIGLVCYDGDVLAAFQSERERVLSEFNGAD